MSATTAALNVTVNKNKVKYTSLSIPTVSNGVTYYNGTYKSKYTFRRVGSSATGIQTYKTSYAYFAKVGTLTVIPQDKMLVHVYGTITRHDMTDKCVFYHYLDEGPAGGDHVILIPCNLQGNTTYVDFKYFNSNHQSTSHFIWTNIFPCDYSYNKVSSPNNIDITVDCYSM